MGFFGKSFEEKVNEAIDELRGRGLVEGLAVRIDDKVVTLTGEAKTADDRAAIMQAFDSMVKTDNTLNQIRVAKPEPAPAATPTTQAESAEGPVAQAPGVTAEAPAGAEAPVAEAGGERWHDVVSGDTLGAISKTYYGKSSLYMKIFEANRDQLDDPNLIKVGQKLRIPSLEEPTA